MTTAISSSIRAAKQLGPCRFGHVYNAAVLLALGSLSVYAATYQQKADSLPSSLPINLCTARRAYDNPSLSKEDLEALTHKEFAKAEPLLKAAALACGPLLSFFLRGVDYAVRKKILPGTRPLPYIAFLTVGAILSYKIQAAWSASLHHSAAHMVIRHHIYAKLAAIMKQRLSHQLSKEELPMRPKSVILDSLINIHCLRQIRVATWFHPDTLPSPSEVWAKEAGDVQEFVLKCAGCFFVCGVPLVPVDGFPHYLPYPRSYIFSYVLNNEAMKKKCKGSCFGSTLVWLKQFYQRPDFVSSLDYCTTPAGREEAYRFSHYQFYVNANQRAAFFALILGLPQDRVQHLPIDGVHYSPNMTSENLFALIDTHKNRSLFLIIQTENSEDQHCLLLHSSGSQHFLYDSVSGVAVFSGRESLAMKASRLYCESRLITAYTIEAPLSSVCLSTT